MAMNARTEAAIAEISTLKPEQFESADINKLLANYNEISDSLVSKIHKWFKLGDSSALQQRKFIELDETAIQSIGASLAPATQKWMVESKSADLAAVVAKIDKLTSVSPALKAYALSSVEKLDSAGKKALLKLFGVRKVEDLPAARGSRKPRESSERQPRTKKEGTAGTRAIRSVKAPMEASEDNLAIIQIYGAPTSRDAHNAAKEVDVAALENSSVKRFVKAVAASRKSAEIEELKERFAKRHADLIERTGSADDSKSEEKPVRPRSGGRKSGGLDVIEAVVGKGRSREKKEEKSSEDDRRNHSHPRESERLIRGNKNPIVRRPSSRVPGKIKTAIRQVRRPA